MQKYKNRELWLVQRMDKTEPDDCPSNPFEAGQWEERKRILAILDNEADNGPVNHIIHLILKDVTA